MPLRVEVPVKLAEPDWVKTQDLHYHACRWIEDEGDEAHHGDLKPFAISPLARDPHSGVDVFEIGLIDDRLVSRFADRVAADEGRLLRFGASDAIVGTPRVIANSTWEELAAAGSPTWSWSVQCLSPVLARQGNDDLSFPYPSLVVGLSKRWGRFSPVQLDTGRELPRLARIHVAGFDGRTAEMSHGKATRTGFVGQVKFGTSEKIRAKRRRVDSLVRLAEFGGMGGMTTYGFGVVALDHRDHHTG